MVYTDETVNKHFKLSFIIFKRKKTKKTVLFRQKPVGECPRCPMPTLHILLVLLMGNVFDVLPGPEGRGWVHPNESQKLAHSTIVSSTLFPNSDSVVSGVFTISPNGKECILVCYLTEFVILFLCVFYYAGTPKQVINLRALLCFSKLCFNNYFPFKTKLNREIK